tara:strand:+ start:731 stop:928 length:198 start_codon:yes stop_codon:yes gene_type:complete
MNVQELIDELMKVKNKSLKVNVFINSTEKIASTLWTELDVVETYEKDYVDLVGDYNNYRRPVDEQ